MHWLMYTSHREWGGCKIWGVFNSREEAKAYYYKHSDADDRFYAILFIERWEGGNKLE